MVDSLKNNHFDKNLNIKIPYKPETIPLKQSPVVKKITNSSLNNQSQEWSKKLNSLINAYDSYRHNFNDLLGVSPTLLRAVEGLYSDYGQYENVPNSGWSYYTPVSLSQQNALSIPDKIAYGTKIYNMLPASILSDEKGAEELHKLHEQDGGNDNNNFDRYTQKFNKALLTQLKNYVDLEGLAQKTDDISRLAYTRLKSYFDIMEIIIDNEKLQEFTGIPLDIKKEKDLFVTKKLLPDPLDAAQKGKPLSLWAEDEKKLVDDLKKSTSFNFLKNYLLDSATTTLNEKNSFYNQSEISFFDPYESLSDTAKNILNIRRNHIEDYIAQLPHDKAQKIRDLFFDSKFLGKYNATHDVSLGNNHKTLPHYYSVDTDFFKKQSEKLAPSIYEFKQKSNDMLNKMNVSDQFYVRKNLNNL